MKIPFLSLAVLVTAIAGISCSRLTPENIAPGTLSEVTLNFSLPSPSSGPMGTKADGQDIYSEFHREMLSGALVAPSFKLVFTEVGSGEETIVEGLWADDTSVSLKKGSTYTVEGQSLADGNNIQDKCSLVFADTFTLGDSATRVDIKADYDCSLLVFLKGQISGVTCHSGTADSDFYILHDKYVYAFVNGVLWDEGHEDDATLEFHLSDGSSNSVPASKVSVEKGSYYVFDSAESFSLGFNLGGMTPGGQSIEEDEEGESVSVALSEAGSLKTALEGRSTEGITSLKVSGVMDARDFNYIKWNVQNVQNVDITEAKIVAYSGSEGTNEGYQESYAADEIPIGAFFYWCSHFEGGVEVSNDEKHYDEGMPSLRSVKLPSGIKAIRRNAFARAYNLTDINFPEGLECIDYVSMRYCVSLETVDLPSTLTSIGLWAFTEMAALKEVRCKAAVPPSLDSSFGTLTDYAGARGWVDLGGYDPTNHKAVLLVPEGSVDAYKNSDWGTFFKDIRALQ